MRKKMTPPVASPEVGVTPVIALTLQTMTIERSGSVEWAVEGDHHCGPKALLKPSKNNPAVNVIPVNYTVRVTCEPHLDERGFLFDQAMVDLWMQRQASYVTKLSCEALVVETAKAMLLKMARDVPHCKVKELVMTLSPAPHQAGVTCRFA